MTFEVIPFIIGAMIMLSCMALIMTKNVHMIPAFCVSTFIGGFAYGVMLGVS